MWRTDADFYWVKRLCATGLSDYRVAALTGIPRATVLRWRRRTAPPHPDVNHVVAEDWRITDAAAYVYLLGCYLGDGHITLKPPQCWTLRIVCDRRYPDIISEIRMAIATTFPDRRTSRLPSSTGAADVLSISIQQSDVRSLSTDPDANTYVASSSPTGSGNLPMHIRRPSSEA